MPCVLRPYTPLKRLPLLDDGDLAGAGLGGIELGNDALELDLYARSDLQVRYRRADRLRPRFR